MKNKTYRDILFVGFLIFAAGPACIVTSSSAPSSPSSTNSRATVAERNSQALGDLGSITYTLDSARQMSKVFDPNSEEGVILTVEDANGYGWMLSIPADALLSTQKITMTPFATMDVSRSDAKIVSGVQFEPDGLQFTDAVQLTVTAPIDNPGVSLIFSMNQDGSNVAFAPTTNTSGGKTAIAQIWHFSAAGYDNGYDAGRDGIDQYQKMAREEYRLALDAARQFIKNGAPRPPTSPSISMFCRGTEVNPEQNEAYEYMREFLDPYSEYVYVLLAAIKDLQLTSGEDVDTTAGTDAIITILQMAEKTLLELGNQYQNDKPPDRLIAAISTGLQIDRQIQLINGETPLLLLEKITYWESTVRDYYLKELKTKHDYRAFPILLTLDKDVQLVGGSSRLEDIMAAMTFEVILDTSFDATWKSQSDRLFATGRVEQHADVKDIKNTLEPPNFLWGTENNIIFKATTGTFKDSTGSYALDGQSDVGTLFLLNWDACVTKTFDMELVGIIGAPDSKSGKIATAASQGSFEKYWWKTALAYIFTVPMQNLNQTLGDKSFSGSGSGAAIDFTSSAQIHIVIKHMPG
ncbi:MAG: hypothetical protein ABSC61_01665 [Anaerolineales bacterium]